MYYELGFLAAPLVILLVLYKLKVDLHDPFGIIRKKIKLQIPGLANRWNVEHVPAKAHTQLGELVLKKSKFDVIVDWDKARFIVDFKEDPQIEILSYPQDLGQNQEFPEPLDFESTIIKDFYPVRRAHQKSVASKVSKDPEFSKMLLTMVPLIQKRNFRTFSLRGPHLRWQTHYHGYLPPAYVEELLPRLEKIADHLTQAAPQIEQAAH